MSDNRVTIRLEPELHEWLRKNGGENMSSVVRTILDDVRAGRLVRKDDVGPKALPDVGKSLQKIERLTETLDVETLERLAQTCESLDISLRRTLDANIRSAQQQKYVRMGAFAMVGIALMILSWSLFGHNDHGALTTTAFHQVFPAR